MHGSSNRNGEAEIKQKKYFQTILRKTLETFVIKTLNICNFIWNFRKIITLENAHMFHLDWEEESATGGCIRNEIGEYFWNEED